MDIAAGLALALLALIAILPEYAVDFVFTAKAGEEFAETGAATQYGPLALANMTGGNQLLIGLGWPMVILIGTWRVRKTRTPPEAAEGTTADRDQPRPGAVGGHRLSHHRLAIRVDSLPQGHSLPLRRSGSHHHLRALPQEALGGTYPRAPLGGSLGLHRVVAQTGPTDHQLRHVRGGRRGDPALRRGVRRVDNRARRGDRGQRVPPRQVDRPHRLRGARIAGGHTLRLEVGQPHRPRAPSSRPRSTSGLSWSAPSPSSSRYSPVSSTASRSKRPSESSCSSRRPSRSLPSPSSPAARSAAPRHGSCSASSWLRSVNR